MVSRIGISARSVVLALFCWLVALPAAAFTISLTVSGTTYNVLFTEGSFDAVNGNPATPLTTTPWFGDSALALALADELRIADSGGPVVPDSGAHYNFAVQVSGLSVSSRTYFGPTAPLAAGFAGATFFTTEDTSAVGASFYYASVAPAAVPEIDGNALAKALFILFALGAWLEARRRRVAG